MDDGQRIGDDRHAGAPTPRQAEQTPVSEAVVRVVIVDDHALVRACLKALINARPDMKVVGEAEGGQKAHDVVRALVELGTPPSVVVIDITMPGGGGAEAAGHIRGRWPGIKLIALSMHEDRAYLLSMLRAGAQGYVLKRSGTDVLIGAIRAVAGGGTYVDAGFAPDLLLPFLRGGAGTAGGGAAHYSGGRTVSTKAAAVPTAILAPPGGGGRETPPLSAREESVLRMVAQGHSNKEIAVVLGINSKTVHTYKARVREKLGLDSRVEIIRYAADRGWIL